MSSDFKELLQEFYDHDVEFIVVGAHAMAVHGHIRSTKDIDIWVRASLENAPRVIAALRSFGAPLHDLAVDDLTTPGVGFQIGVRPVRIDVLTEIDGVDFAEAWEDRVRVDYMGVPVSVLSREKLIRNKTAAGQTQDIADVEWLIANPEEDDAG